MFGKEFFTIGLGVFSLCMSIMAYRSGREAVEVAQHGLEPAVFLYSSIQVPPRSTGEADQHVTVSWNLENTGRGPAFVLRALLIASDGTVHPMASQEAWQALRLALEAQYDLGPLAGYTNDAPECPYAISAPADWAPFSLTYLLEADPDDPEGVLEQFVEPSGIELGICYCTINDDCRVARTRGFPDGLCPEVRDADLLHDLTTCPPAN